MNLENIVPPVSAKIEKYWNEVVCNYWGNFSTYDKKFPQWHELSNVGEMFDALKNYYVGERHEFKTQMHKGDNKENTYGSMTCLTMLKKEGIDMGQVLEKSDPYKFFSYLGMYLEYLLHEKEEMSQALLDSTLKQLAVQKRYSTCADCNENIGIFMDILRVVPPKSHTWFTHQLEVLTYIWEEGESVDNSQNLNYQKQKAIYGYVREYYPEKLEENSRYYPSLMQPFAFKKKNLYQCEMEIDCFSLIHSYGLSIEVSHAVSVITECLKVVARQDFQSLLSRSVIPESIHDDRKSESQIILSFSTSRQEDSEYFQNVLQSALAGIFPVMEKIKIFYDDDDSVSTNMTAQFIYQHYMHEHLSKTLETSPTKKSFKI